MPSSVPSAPADAAAVYSPRLWPATKSGTSPRARATSSTASEIANSAGWATSVRVSYSIGPSRHSFRSSSPDASAAAAK